MVIAEYAPDIEEEIRIYIVKHGMKPKKKPDSKIKLSVYPDPKENLTVLEEIVNDQPKRIKTSKLETLEIKNSDIEESLSIISYNENQIPTNDWFKFQ